MSRQIASLTFFCSLKNVRHPRQISGKLWSMVIVFSLLALGIATPGHAQSSSDPICVFHTSLGDISVQLYPDVAPKTVANFLSYVKAGAYDNSLIHRSVPGFIIQGGGYQTQPGPSISTIPTNPPVVNEFHLSNTRGTLAMAKLGGDPNSATSEWFFNESDSNATNLDNQNGGFTVFGKVLNAASLAVMDKLAAVPVPSPSPFASPLNQIPLINYQSGQAVQISNLVIISSITLAPDTHILWDNINGTASLWNYSTTTGAFTQSTFGPYAGWSAKAIADGGTDGKTRLLWNNANGTAALWTITATGSFTTSNFGPYSGWTANAVSVGSDNTTHLLWTNTNGTAALWNVVGGAYQGEHDFGPYAGWTAKAIADGGTDGKTRMLWTNTNGQAAFWDVNPATGAFSQFSFGPYAGWTAKAVSVSATTTHILWSNTNGTQSVWNFNPANGTFTTENYGPYSGWSANAIADGSDGKVRLLWNNVSGQASFWSLDNSTGLFGAFSFGPYSGWTATAISAGE